MRTKDSPTYLTTSIAKLIALGIGENEPINIRRLDIQEYVANNLEKLLTVAPKADTVEEETETTEQVTEFKFE
jgi:hypothetical protein